MRIGYLMQEGVDVRHPPYDGPANHVREVVQALGERGHQVRLVVRVDGRIWRTDDLTEFRSVTAHGWDRGLRRLFERVVRRVQYEVRLPYAALFESLRFAQVCVQALKGFDLLYERLGWVASGGGLAAGRLGVPLVLEDNGDQMLDLESKGLAPVGLQRRLSVSLMRQAVRRAAHVVSTGAGWRERFIETWDYEPRKVTTVENGTALLHRLGREQLRSFRLIEDEDAAAPFTLVYLGGFYPWHGVPNLLRAVASARALGARVKAVMVGSGDGLEESQRLTRSLGLDDEVRFAGHLEPERYAPLLADADVGMAPYCGWPEFSGLKVLDYKAAGLPTIASGRNGHPPTIEHGRTGLIVPPCEDEALATAIVQLGRDIGLRRRMGQAARREAEVQHGWSHTAERIDTVLRGVLNHGVTR